MNNEKNIFSLKNIQAFKLFALTGNTTIKKTKRNTNSKTVMPSVFIRIMDLQVN